MFSLISFYYCQVHQWYTMFTEIMMFLALLTTIIIMFIAIKKSPNIKTGAGSWVLVGILIIIIPSFFHMVEIIDSLSIGSLLSEDIYSFFSINEKVFMGIGSTLTMYGLYRQFIIGEEQAKRIVVQKEQLDLHNHVANIFLKNSGDEIYAKVLDAILRATGSKYGIFGFINENGSWECRSERLT